MATLGSFYTFSVTYKILESRNPMQGPHLGPKKHSRGPALKPSIMACKNGQDPPSKHICG